MCEIVHPGTGKCVETNHRSLKRVHGFKDLCKRHHDLTSETLVGLAPYAVKAAAVMPITVSRCGLAARRLAGKQKDLGSIRFGSPFSSLQNLWFTDIFLRLCPHN